MNAGLATIKFSDEALEAIDWLSKYQRRSREEVLAGAIAHELLLWKEHSKGHKILIKHKDDHLFEIVIE